MTVELTGAFAASGRLDFTRPIRSKTWHRAAKVGVASNHGAQAKLCQPQGC
jgi:hypothetical protein